MSDYLTHDKVVVSSPEIKMGYVKPISSFYKHTESAMAALLIIKADRRLSQIYGTLFKLLGDRNSLELFREWSEKRINCKVLGQTGSLAEVCGILEKLNGNSRIRRITT